MILDEIGEYLNNIGTVTTEMRDGYTRLFLHESPSEARESGDIFALLHVNLAGFSVNEELPDYHKGTVQIITSATKFDDGYELALQLSKELHVYGKRLETFHIVKCVPISLPISYRRNEQNLVEHSVNFNVVLRLIQ